MRTSASHAPPRAASTARGRRRALQMSATYQCCLWRQGITQGRGVTSSMTSAAFDEQMTMMPCWSELMRKSSRSVLVSSADSAARKAELALQDHLPGQGCRLKRSMFVARRMLSLNSSICAMVFHHACRSQSADAGRAAAAGNLAGGGRHLFLGVQAAVHAPPVVRLHGPPFVHSAVSLILEVLNQSVDNVSPAMFAADVCVTVCIARITAGVSLHSTFASGGGCSVPVHITG